MLSQIRRGGTPSKYQGSAPPSFSPRNRNQPPAECDFTPLTGIIHKFYILANANSHSHQCDILLGRNLQPSLENSRGDYPIPAVHPRRRCPRILSADEYPLRRIRRCSGCLRQFAADDYPLRRIRRCSGCLRQFAADDYLWPYRATGARGLPTVYG